MRTIMTGRLPFREYLEQERLLQGISSMERSEPTTEAAPPDTSLLDAAESLREHIVIGATLDDASRDRLMASEPFKAFSRIVRQLIPIEERMDLYGDDLRHDGGQIDVRGDIP